jgi:UDP-3-O-[3-hydroxymyristoyl] glucosamine N-acyltransferase
VARSLGELAVMFGCELIGDPEVIVDSVATLSNAGTGQLSFNASDAYLGSLRETRAAAVILRPSDVDKCPVAALVTGNPYLVYARIAGLLHPEPDVVPGVHQSAAVSSSANISPGAEIAANATVGDDCIIGDGAYVGPGVVVGSGCSVGSGTLLFANSVLVRDVKIGERCIVHPGAIIGSDGFGNVMSDQGWVKLPQIGGVRIGNDVEIGANTTIDRGALQDTVIGDGVRIDNLVQIAHNVQIGDHTAIAAQVGIAGSTIVGKRCMFAGQAGIVGHINICDDVIVAGKTVISKHVTIPGFYAGSIPGEPDKDWKRKVARFRRLDSLFDRVTRLEQRAKSDGE